MTFIGLTRPATRFAFAACCLLLAGPADAQHDPARDDVDAVHQALLRDRFPAASECRGCHARQYEEWSASPHAYAQLSVVYQSMQAAVLTLTNGSNGDFCIRCHTPVGMALGEPAAMANASRAPVSREGVTCIACHRIAEDYGRNSGRSALREGPLCDPVFGPSGGPDGRNTEVTRVLDDPGFDVVGCDENGRTIHEASLERGFLPASRFCGSCHDVRFVNGFRLEDLFSEYHVSPAARAGTTCQDCHMGTIPGVASPRAQGPAARIDGRETRERALANHRFDGPDHSVIHPGLFPHDPKAEKLADFAAWTQFDYRAGWGDRASDFERAARRDRPDDLPDAWRSAAKRRRARAFILEQCERLDEMEASRLAILQEGYRLEGLEVKRADERGLDFRVRVANGTDGHGVPSGFDAERLVFLRVLVRDADGQVVFRSGDRDPNGDLRDPHSRYVHAGRIERDASLFSLQSKFLTRNLRGSEREQVLAVNRSLDPLPFVRPEPRATSLFGRPRAARKHKQTILPGQQRVARYAVAGDALTGRPPYRVEIALVAQMVPVNLVGEIAFMGFEYGMSAREVADAVVAGAQVLWRIEAPLVDADSDEGSAALAERGLPMGAPQCRGLE